MKKLFNFKRLTAKMLVGFSIVIILVVILAVYNFAVIKVSNKSAESVKEKQLPLLIADEQLARTMANRIATARGYVLFGGDYRDQFNAYTEQGKHYEDVVKNIETREEFKELIDRTVEWREFVNKEVFDEFEKGNKDVALHNLEKVAPDARDIMDGYEEMADKREELIDKKEQEIISSGEKTQLVSIVISILIVVLSVIVALVTSRTITKPIKKVMQRMKLIADGDLRQEPLKITTRDELGQLMAATNDMNASMREVVTKIDHVTETVSSHSEELTQAANEVTAGSQQIATTMQELASGSERQANSAGDLSASMRTFTTKVEDANTEGKQIQHSSVNVLEMTEEGSQLMGASSEQMVQIDHIVQESVQKVQGLDVHSQNISKLVSIIKDVAEQTNLLALNAAIEAARAGEHGKGFAVVADEVRKLAEQTSESVTDITGIVDRIQSESSNVTQALEAGYKEVEKGTNQITTTGETFTKISKAVTEMATSINTVSKNLSDIAMNSQEMNGVIEDIAAVSQESAAGVEQTSASSQQTSSSMEEVTSSSEELSKLAEELNGLIRQFKL
ncbi:methyl-accepting chemotaxis protein [Lentibacillus sp. N15]|uniref:methyl-accepting chemotaxis protein n=1 Tax=Lentibacillus songyuanensis TaxID=3136161 RepID=UPI0031BAA96F